MTTPEQQRIEENAEFVAGALGWRLRVLEVGCGRGAMARTLAARGYDVTAIDVALRDVVEGPGVRFVEADLLAYEDAPFDAIVFTSSLHHIAPLDAAIERAVRLLKPGGRLVADELDLEAPDAETLRWYYEMQEFLVTTGRYPGAHLDAPHADPIARWRHAHHHDASHHHGAATHADHHHAPLHTGAAMRAAIGARFTIVDETRLAYLYRYVAAGLTADAEGAELAAQVRTGEQRRIAHGTIRAVGLRVIADLAPA